MAVYHVKSTGTKSSGASTADDWTNANCYPIGSLAIPFLAADDGESIIFDDETHSLTTTEFLKHGTSSISIILRSRSADATLCIISNDSGTANPISMNSTATTSDTDFQDITFTASVDVTGTAEGVMRIRDTTGDVTFTRCVFRDMTSTNANSGNALCIRSSNTNRTITYANCSFSALNSTSTGGGRPTIAFNQSGDTTNITDCTFTNITNSANAINWSAFYNAGHINWTDSNIVSASLVHTSTYSTFGFLKNVGGTCTVDGGNITGIAVTASSGSASGSFVYTDRAVTIRNIRYYSNTAVTSGQANGGICFAAGTSASSDIQDCLAYSNTGMYGAGFYVSQGASGEGRRIQAYNNSGPYGADLYSGGWGDTTWEACLTYGSTSTDVATARSVYAHNRSDSTRNKTVSIYNCTFIDGAAQAVPLVTFRNDSDVAGAGNDYSLTINLQNSIVRDDNDLIEIVNSIGDDAVEYPVITFNIDECNIQGGATGITDSTGGNYTENYGTNQSGDPLFTNTTNNDYTLTKLSPSLGYGSVYWANEWPPTLGDPLPNINIDIGAYQSVYGPFHPVNL